MYFVYVLYSKKLNKRYIGQTQNLTARVKEHNSGKSQFTSTGIPWELIYFEEHSTRSEAMKRERFLKTGQGRKFLDEIIRDRGFSARG